MINTKDKKEKIIRRFSKLPAGAVYELTYNIDSEEESKEQTQEEIKQDKLAKASNYTNSSLVSYTKISPNKTSPRNHTIDTITIHCVVGQTSVQSLGNHFGQPSVEASSNYGVGYDGKIGMYVEEKDRSWCSSSRENDNRAVTIEVASDTTEPYAVKDVAYDATIKLVTDICKRNGIKKLVWSTDKNTRVNHLNGCNMTVHRDYAAKSCPGTYLYDRMGDIAAKVNANLGSSTDTPTTVKTYEVYVPISTYNSASDAKAQKNAKGTYQPGTYYIYNGYPNGYDGMYNITKDSTGKAAGSWINPTQNVKPYAGTFKAGAEMKLSNVNLYVSATATNASSKVTGTYYVWSTEIINNRIKITNATKNVGVSGQVTGFINFSDSGLTQEEKPAPAPADNLYRVRKSKDDVKTQYGAYSNLENAKAACQAAGPGYHVFDGNYNIVYSYTPTKEEPKPEPQQPEEQKPTPTEPTKVYDLDYSNPVQIVDLSTRTPSTSEYCTKAIKKIISNNSSFDINIAKAFFKLAPIYKIDPMMAISQSVLETGWFKFEGSSVKPEQHNYCGLGATGGGVGGASFATIEDGVTAQLQHLYAYGTKDALPSGQTVIDPRFDKVSRGIAKYWEQLAGRWAVPGYDSAKFSTPEEAMKAGDTYGQKIGSICDTLKVTAISQDDIDKYFPEEVTPEPEPTPNPDDENKENVNVILRLLRKLLEFFVHLFGLDKEEK